MGALSSAPKPRPSKDERRAQLLEVAGDLLVEGGLAGFTMEGLAAAAGVSKALPYRHFSNAEAVVIELYRRVLGELDAQVIDAAAAAGPGDAKVAAAVRAYFRFVGTQGRLLGVLAGPGSAIPELAEGTRPLPQAALSIVEDAYGITGSTASALGVILNGIASAGAESVARRLVSVREAEAMTTAAILGAVHAVLGEVGTR